ncbi:SPOR domain-containing protein [Actinotalea sp.]|uniref:SPOR domain-containing protein n=1 Tax=Actinotalea sp. TaxID=1872145 RepID=UPI0035692099
MSDEDGEYWFNLTTHEVERGRVSSWEHRLGPYPTREAAERALQEAKERTEAWDEADEKWKRD